MIMSSLDTVVASFDMIVSNLDTKILFRKAELLFKRSLFFLFGKSCFPSGRAEWCVFMF